ncbi:MAG TPA: zinc ribbon domain-containing protein [Hyphomicrobiaceae bacterium]
MGRAPVADGWALRGAGPDAGPSLLYSQSTPGTSWPSTGPFTSQTSPECGIVAAKTLAEREHRCDCGCVLDRDFAAAKVVHFRAFGFWPGAGRGSPTQRVAA